MANEFENHLLASINNLNRNVNELIWANTFHDAIKGCAWLDKDNFAINPGRWAVGYNYFYVVFRILNEFKPKKILELGLGQSSRLIGQYVKTRNKSEVCYHDILEHDANFAKVAEENFNFSPLTKINVVNITKTTLKLEGGGGNNCIVTTYESEPFKEIVAGQKYDFISIDGPYGSSPLSRIDLLPYLPQCLKENFCIVIDDFNRIGEQNTVALIRDIFRQNNIEYCETVYFGSKDLYLIASANSRWLSSM